MGVVGREDTDGCVQCERAGHLDKIDVSLVVQ